MIHARGEGFQLHRGVYASMLGPNYETRAEYRYLRKIGADAVGMSTVPEVAVAATYQMRIMAMSIITNVANPDQLIETSGHGVIDAAAIAAPKLSAHWLRMRLRRPLLKKASRKASHAFYCFGKVSLLVSSELQRWLKDGHCVYEWCCPKSSISNR